MMLTLIIHVASSKAGRRLAGGLAVIVGALVLLVAGLLIVTVAAWPMSLTTSVAGQMQTDLPAD